MSFFSLKVRYIEFFDRDEQLNRALSRFNLLFDISSFLSIFFNIFVDNHILYILKNRKSYRTYGLFEQPEIDS
jgi:hypothetical protein